MSFSLWAVKVPEERPKPFWVDLKHVLVESGILPEGASRSHYKVRLTPEDPKTRSLITYLQGYKAALPKRPSAFDDCEESLQDDIDEFIGILKNDTGEFPNGIDLWIGEWNDYGDPEPDDDITTGPGERGTP